MSDNRFLDEYFARYRVALFETDARATLLEATELVKSVRTANRKLLIAGNGGSAAMADHAAVDFTKQAGVRAMSFSAPGMLTAFSNDYGYEHWLARAIEFYSEPGDVVVLISTSGRSLNILNGAHAAQARGLDVITFSGHSPDNPLRTLGRVNFWLDSKAYNIVENIHQIWLLTICDLIVGKAEYSVS